MCSVVETSEDLYVQLLLLLLLLIRHFETLLNVNNITKAPAVFSFQSRHEIVQFLNVV